MSNKNLLIQEDWVNVSEKCGMGKSGVYETAYEDIGELFRSCQKTYGRCVSKVFVDTADEPEQIGWVFQKRQKYEDIDETFLMETWVSVHKSEPDHHTTYHYLPFSEK